MTWQELVVTLGQRFSLEQPSADQLAITLSFEAGRSQLIVVDRFDALDQEWVSLRSRVCGEHRMDPTEALLRNAQLVVGDLCLDGAVYLLKSTLLLAALALDEFVLLLRVLGRTADELEDALETGADTF